MRKLLFLFIFSLLFLSLVSAQQESLANPVSVGQVATIKQTCSNCTYVYISSINYPNSTIAISNKTMTSSTYEYSYDFNLTSVQGTYTVTTCGDPDGVTTCVPYTFEVNNSGSTFTIAQALVYIIFLIAIFSIFFLSLYYAITIPFSNNRDSEGYVVNVNKYKYLKIFLVPVTYVMFMLICAILYQITYNFLYFPSASTTFHWLYTILLSFMWPLLVVSFLIMFLMLLMNIKLEKRIKRGGRIK